jgi:hypothetical protein
LIETGNGFQNGTFPRTAFSEQPDDFAFFHGKGDIPHAVIAFENAVESIDGKHV